MATQDRVATLADWVTAPRWVTVAEASHLSGFDPPTLQSIIEAGGVDVEQDGDTWLIEKRSLYEFQEALALVLHWDD